MINTQGATPGGLDHMAKPLNKLHGETGQVRPAKCLAIPNANSCKQNLSKILQFLRQIENIICKNISCKMSVKSTTKMFAAKFSPNHFHFCLLAQCIVNDLTPEWSTARNLLEIWLLNLFCSFFGLAIETECFYFMNTTLDLSVLCRLTEKQTAGTRTSEATIQKKPL